MDINLFELQDALDVLKQKGISTPQKEEIEEEVKKQREDKYGTTKSKTTKRKSTRGK